MMPFKSPAALVLFALPVAVAGCRDGTSVTVGPSLAVEGRTSAAPSIAASGEYVAVAWSAATRDSMDVYSALSTDAGKTFGAPVRVNAVPGDARVGAEQPPRIAFVPGAASWMPEVVVVWTTKAPKGTRLLVARSTDGAKTFAAAVPVPGSEGPGSRGWHSIAVDSAGRVMVLWLDHRASAGMASAHQHAGPAATKPAPAPKGDPTERAALSSVYFASLTDTAATVVADGVCYCCKTGLSVSGRTVAAAWRHVYPESQRDIAFASSSDGGRTFSTAAPVSRDGWKIDGCPENGPTVATENGVTDVVWPAPPDGKSDTPLALFHAVSRSGAPFSPRVQVPTRGPAGHVQIARSRMGVTLVAWDEVVNGARHLAAATVSTGSQRYVPLEISPGTTTEGWPALAAATDRVVIAWIRGTGPGNAIATGSIQ